MKYLRHAQRVWHYPEVDPILELLTKSERDALTKVIATVIQDALNPPREFKMLRLTSIYPPKLHATMDPDFLESVRQCGIMDSIVVHEKANGRYSIVDGRARFMAAQELGLPVIPATIVRES